MATHIESTIAECQRLSTIHTHVAVGFSGGKDSLATLDLACRFFKHVYAFYFYFIPDLEIEEEKLMILSRRFKMTLLRYPDPHTLDQMRKGIYCDRFEQLHEIPEMSPRDWFDIIKGDTGATLLMNGEKKSDGVFRRNKIAGEKRLMSDTYRPLADWKKWEVLNYLKARNIPIPDAGSGDNGGASLIVKEILHLYDHYPNDFEKLKSFFPYVEVPIKQREFFGKVTSG
jgi:3'-phosphoadenosine 5'-phosphosulfate sulfotransferase (PAPS reductase)/FAD synthetase